MTLLVSIFGFAGRFAGDLLTTALGWASSLLFGRVPRRHQTYLVLMMALSFFWLLAVLAVLLPALASFLLAATPHPGSVDKGWVDYVLIVLVAGLPLAVGVTGFLVPARGARPEGAAIVVEVLRGYLLAPVLSGLLLFLAVVGIVRKIRSARHGWSDAHVAIVVEPRGYEQLAHDLQDALVSAGLEVIAHDAPAVLMVPARVLSAVAGRNVAGLRQDHLVELRGQDLRIGVYPSDIAISGKTRDRTRARAAVISRLTTTSAHMTTSSEAQSIEDDLQAVAQRGHRANASREAAQKALDAIDEELLGLVTPTDEWDILYRIRLQVERDILLGDQAERRRETSPDRL